MINYIIGGIIIIIFIYFIIKLKQKQIIDNKEYYEYLNATADAKIQLQNVQTERFAAEKEVERLEKEYLSIVEKNKQITEQNQNDLDLYFSKQKEFRQSELDTEFDRLRREKEENLKNKYIEFEREELEKEHKFRQEVSDIIEAAKKSQNDILADTLYQQQRYENLLAPLQQYEKEKQDKLFYTIQTPDEYKQDIEFLLTNVAPKIQHPDIINKLVWAEYIKPYIDETFKRVEIKDEPGIYKLTNLDTGKAYIGKSTNIKKRITDHFKSSIGITNIADQAVHHAILETGFWNWSIECITYCDKDKLNELEKYYIDFFKTQEFGYNRKQGG